MRVRTRFFDALTVSVGLVLLVIGHEATAAASAEAKISNIAITLTDLNLTDEITPSITFSGLSAGAAYVDPLAGFPNRPSPDPAVYHYENTPSFLGVISVSTLFPGAAGLASTLDFSFPHKFSACSQPFSANFSPAFSKAFFAAIFPPLIR